MQSQQEVAQRAQQRAQLLQAALSKMPQHWQEPSKTEPFSYTRLPSGTIKPSGSWYQVVLKNDPDMDQEDVPLVGYLRVVREWKPSEPLHAEIIDETLSTTRGAHLAEFRHRNKAAALLPPDFDIESVPAQATMIRVTEIERFRRYRCHQFPAAEVRQIAEELGIPPQRHIVIYCRRIQQKLRELNRVARDTGDERLAAYVADVVERLSVRHRLQRAEAAREFVADRASPIELCTVPAYRRVATVAMLRRAAQSVGVDTTGLTTKTALCDAIMRAYTPAADAE